MSELEIIRYQTTIPPAVAEQLAVTFEHNYPESHPNSERLADLKKHAGAVAIQGLINEGRTLYVASYKPESVAGILESRVVDQADGTYEQLVWLMTSAGYRGRGVASGLHDKFISDAQVRAEQRIPKPSLALLSVNAMNPAKDIYRRWGYQERERTSTGKIMMVKPLLPRG